MHIRTVIAGIQQNLIMHRSEKEKLAEQDPRIFNKGVTIAMVAAVLWWLLFYFINS